jgi:membrane associated rhomboid family serine protease
VSDAPSSSANFCYRHPDRQSFVLCQRCGRTICPECQTQAAVGVHCPECVKEARASAPRTRPAIVTALRGSGQPVVTWSLIGVTLLVYIAQIIPGSPVGPLGTYYPVRTLVAPWTMITAIFLHGSVLHILFNMFSLFVFGPILERMLGRSRFLALYLVSGLGGSVAVLLLDPMGGVLGASGAIFGLMGAFFVIQRGLGGNNVQILIVIGINLVSGFLLPGVSWQAHLGGVVTGAVLALLYMRTRKRSQRTVQIALVGAVVAALIALSLVLIFVIG